MVEASSNAQADMVEASSNAQAEMVTALTNAKTKMVIATSNVQAKDPAINSVEKNKTMNTDCQIMRAKMARQIYHSLGTPSVNDFKAILKMNAIRNLPITIEDIKLAEQIFGPDIGSLKGKTTRGKPSPVVSDFNKMLYYVWMG
jgi:hypothetical protein